VYVGVSVPAGTGGAPFFEDNFDTGQRGSANGFIWRGGTRTAVSSAQAHSGAYSLAFTYPAAPFGSDSFSEQRFDMGRYINEVWMDYMLYVPANFVHRKDEPSNNKFFMLWRDIYSDVAGGTQQFGMEFYYRNATSSFARPTARIQSHGLISTIAGSAGPALVGPFAPIKPGQWSHIRLHMRGSSAYGISDGIYKYWVNGQLIESFINQPYYNTKTTPTDVMFRNGYLLGWANSGYAEETVFNIDDVKFYDNNPGW
jgi:hypothetical protein